MDATDQSVEEMDESMEGNTDDDNDESNGIYYPWSEFFVSGREETLELDGVESYDEYDEPEPTRIICCILCFNIYFI